MRRTKGRRAQRLIVANADTQFIITSCSDNVDVARPERYSVLANEGGTTPVLFLTKVEEAADVRAHLNQVRCPQNAACRGKTRRNIQRCGAGGDPVVRRRPDGCPLRLVICRKILTADRTWGKAPKEAQLTAVIREADSMGR